MANYVANTSATQTAGDARWALKARQSFNVRDYGAVGNGVTDDAAAIRAAITAAGDAGGGEVIIPTGTYIMLTRIDMRSNVTVRGLGRAVLKATVDSRFTSAGTVRDGYFFQCNVNVTRSALVGLAFDAAAINGGIVFIDRGISITVSKCTHVSTGGQVSSIRGVMINNGNDIEVSDCVIEKTQYGVFVYGGGDNIRILRNKIFGTGSENIRIADDYLWASNIIVDGNHLDGAGHSGSLVHIGAPSGDNMLTDFYRNVRVTNNIAIGSFTSKLTAGGNNDILSLRGMKNAVVAGNRVEGGGDLGLVIEVCEDVTVTGNVVRLNEISGLVVHKSKRVSVTGNTCIDNATMTGATSPLTAIGAGIRIMAASTDITVSGNTCTDTRPAGSKTQYYGVGVYTGSGLPLNLNMGNNMVIGNKWGGYYTDNNGTDCQITDEIPIASTATLPLEHAPKYMQVRSRNITTGQPALLIADASGVTTTGSSAAAAATTVVSSGVGTLTPNLSVVGVLMDNNTVHWSIVTAQAGTTLTLATPFPSAAASGNVIKYTRYKTVINYA